MRTRHQFPFQIETWSDDGMRSCEIVAGADNLSVALAAYNEQINADRRSWITLRHGARVLYERKFQG